MRSRSASGKSTPTTTGASTSPSSSTGGWKTDVGGNGAGARDPHTWALVLAGGEGRRMRHLTVTAAGVSVPKQFCSLGRGPSLLHAALQRARAVAPPARIVVTVSEEH